MSSEPPISGKSAILLGILPAIVVLGGFGAGLFLSLQAKPDLPEPEIVEEEMAEPEPPAPPKRMYIDIINPIRATVPELGGTVNINIGLAMRDDVGRLVKDTLAESPEQIMAPLTEVVLSLVETLPPGSDWQDLRALIPPALRDKLNEGLTAPDRPDPVYEVLIMNFSTGT